MKGSLSVHREIQHFQHRRHNTTAMLAPLLLYAVLHAHFAAAHNHSVTIQHLKLRVDAQAIQLQKQRSELVKLSGQLQHLSQKVARMETDVGNNHLSLRKLEDARPKQVAFSFTHDLTSLYPRYKENMEYNTLITDIGYAGYNYQTGNFTAPYAGVYVFYAKIHTQKLPKWEPKVAIYKEGVRLTEAWAMGVENTDSAFVTTHLKVGENVSVRTLVHRRTMVAPTILNMFSGVLVAADRL